jgi:hypothetical protein
MLLDRGVKVDYHWAAGRQLLQSRTRPSAAARQADDRYRKP